MGMNCPTLQYLQYGAFSERLKLLTNAQRVPLSVSFEVTMRCNLRCLHCYVPLTQRKAAHADELTLTEIQHIFGEMADAGTLWMLLTGGEPFLRPDFLQIYDAAKRKGFILTIFTNATLITEEIADHLAEYRPFGIEVSLYGANQGTYEKVTGIPGSFKRCMQGIELLLEKKLPLSLKSVVLTLNQDEILQMKQFTESLGLKFYYDPVIMVGLDGNADPLQYRLSVDRILAQEQQDADKVVAYGEIFDSMQREFEPNPMLYTCNAGHSGFHLDAAGRMSLCLSARQPSYDLRSGSFREGWEEFLPGVLAQTHSQAYVCNECELRIVCLQCPALALNELGDQETRVPFLCELAHERQRVYDKN